MATVRLAPGPSSESLQGKNPREMRARASLSAFDVAATEHTQRRHVADADEFRCRFERDLAALRPLAVAEDVDVVVIAEAAHALLRPGIAVPGLDASAIEQARDLPIGHQPRQLTHERDRVVGDAWIVPADRIQSL
jgi:hypothetical protein